MNIFLFFISHQKFYAKIIFTSIKILLSFFSIQDPLKSVMQFTQIPSTTYLKKTVQA